MFLRSFHVPSALAGAGSFAILFFLFFGFNYRDQYFPVSAPSLAWENASDCNLQDIQNRTLGFEKIFVINLPSRTDHRDSMTLAAALSGLDIEYIDGVTDVEEKTLPPGAGDANLNKGNLCAWRAHINAIQKVVEQNLTSALILEDDVDWDVRIKAQLQDFSKASRMLVQPLQGTTDKFLDRTYPEPAADQEPQDLELGGEEMTTVPTTSPYGDIDRWDVLWLGHCGVRFPQPSDQSTPLGRVVIANDSTVPEPQHISAHFGTDELQHSYPAHTRVVSRARAGTCTLAYAVSRPGARRLLYELGLRQLTANTDLMLRSICDGTDGGIMRTCLTVQPQLFAHHRPVGPKLAFSDISDHGDGYNAQAFTRNIRWSTRLNFPRLVDGRTFYIDLFEDGHESPLRRL